MSNVKNVVAIVILVQTVKHLSAGLVIFLVPNGLCHICKTLLTVLFARLLLKKRRMIEAKTRSISKHPDVRRNTSLEDIGIDHLQRKLTCVPLV